MADLSVRETEAAARAVERGRARPGAGRRSEAVLAWLFLLPSAVLLGAFAFFPLLYAFYVSLHHWTLVKGAFVGFGNYTQALKSEPEFWDALRVTVYYVLGTVPATLVVGFLIAELLNRRLGWLRDRSEERRVGKG